MCKYHLVAILGLLTLQAQAAQMVQPGSLDTRGPVRAAMVPSADQRVWLTERQAVAVRSVSPFVCLAAAAGSARYAATHVDNNGRVLTFGLFAVAGLIATESIMNLHACWKRYRALPNQEPVHPATAVPSPEERG